MSSKELNELNNIKYKSNLKSLNITTKMEDDLHNLDNFLEQEKSQCNNDSWGKIDKNKRLEKLIQFADVYRVEKNMSGDEYDKLVLFFNDCVEKKRFNKTKDVVYDKKTGLIKTIPGLMINKQNNFTIKNLDTKNGAFRCAQTKKTCKKIIEA